MLAPLLAAAVLAGAPAPKPSAVLVVARRSGATEEVALRLLSSVHEALVLSGVEASEAPQETLLRLEAQRLDPAKCQGDRACLARLGRSLDRAALVTLDVALVLDEYAVRIEGVSCADGRLLAGTSLSGTYDDVRRSVRSAVLPLAKAVAQALARSADAPKKDLVVSAPPPKPPEATGSATPWILGGSAAALAVASAGLGAAGLAGKAEIDRLAAQGAPYPITRTQMDASVRATNLQLNLALAAAAVALGLGGMAAWTALDETR